MASVAKREWTHKGQAKSAWIVRYVDHTGTHKQKTFEKKKDADVFRNKTEAEIVSRSLGTHIERRTVKQLCDEFIVYTEGRYRDGRIRRARFQQLARSVRVSIEPTLGHMDAADVRLSHVQDCYAANRKRLCADQAKRELGELRSVMEYGLRRGYLRINPVPEALQELRGRTANPIRVPTIEEIKALLAAVGNRPKFGQRRSWLFLRCAVHLAVFCGLRKGEVFGITRENLLLDERVLQVRHSINDQDELGPPKTKAGNRDVPLPPHLVDFLAEYMREYPSADPRGVIFRLPSGKCINTGTFHTWLWQPLLVRAGIMQEGRGMHFHALRHFAASWMIANGFPLPDVAAHLGHSKFDMTLETYAHALIPGKRRSEMLDGMSARLLTMPQLAQEMHTAA